MKDVKKVIADLVKDGAVLVKDATVKSITVGNYKSNKDVYRLNITIDKEVDAMVDDGNGVYNDGKANIIFVSVYSLSRIIADNEELAFCRARLMANPEAFEMLLSYAKVDVLVVKVAEGEVEANPFSSKEPNDDNKVEQDGYRYYITNIELGRMGKKFIERLEQKTIDDMFE